MRIENIEYEAIDTIKKITIADIFIKEGNKIGRGDGAAKLYIGQTNVTKA